MDSSGTNDDVEGVVEIDIPSSFELVTVVRMLVAAAATSQNALRGDRLDDLLWVTSEAVTNAIQANHAKAEEQDRSPGRVRASYEIGHELVRLTVTDEGIGMPVDMPVPDMEHPDRLHLEGGFGVPLMRQLTKGAISFDSSSKGTTVTLEVHQQ